MKLHRLAFTKYLYGNLFLVHCKSLPVLEPVSIWLDDDRKVVPASVGHARFAEELDNRDSVVGMHDHCSRMRM
jgi:hypothetical protein